MQFKLQIIKYSVLSYRPNFTLHKKTTKLYKIFIQTNSPIFAAKLQNNILIFQQTGFFCFYTRVFRININKAQMTKGSSRVFSREEAKISKRSSHLSTQMTLRTIIFEQTRHKNSHPSPQCEL